MPRNNKNKGEADPEIDSVLDETPPDFKKPIPPEEDDEVDDKLPDPENDEPEEEVVVEEIPVEDKTPIVEPTSTETPEQKDQRYKSQQTEAQIQAERNKALTDKVEEADKATITDEEAKAFATKDGLNWDELTNFEQIMAKKTYLSEKKFNLVNESVQNAKKVDQWAASVDEFIDTTDGKPEFIDLSSHEVDFRKFAMKEAHRGTPMDILLGAFLHNLPPAKPNRGSLFNSGSGGEKQTPKSDGIIDADQAKVLRETKPREYNKLVRAGKIKIDI